MTELIVSHLTADDNALPPEAWDGVLRIQQGDHEGQPLKRMLTWDNRTIELWSLDPLDVEAFAQDYAGPYPAEPIWVPGGSFATSVSSQSGSSDAKTGDTTSAGLTTSDNQSGDTENQLLFQVWQNRITQWQTELQFGQTIANLLLERQGQQTLKFAEPAAPKPSETAAKIMQTQGGALPRAQPEPPPALPPAAAPKLVAPAAHDTVAPHATQKQEPDHLETKPLHHPEKHK